jgi:hypothetical protein
MKKAFYAYGNRERVTRTVDDYTLVFEASAVYPSGDWR